jgi:hypothetical protein
VSSSWAKRAEKETRPLVRFRDIENPLNAHTLVAMCVYRLDILDVGTTS